MCVYVLYTCHVCNVCVCVIFVSCAMCVDVLYTCHLHCVRVLYTCPVQCVCMCYIRVMCNVCVCVNMCNMCVYRTYVDVCMNVCVCVYVNRVCMWMYVMSVYMYVCELCVCVCMRAPPYGRQSLWINSTERRSFLAQSCRSVCAPSCQQPKIFPRTFWNPSPDFWTWRPRAWTHHFLRECLTAWQGGRTPYRSRITMVPVSSGPSYTTTYQQVCVCDYGHSVHMWVCVREVYV